jgi:hypothetical protein
VWTRKTKTKQKDSEVALGATCAPRFTHKLFGAPADLMADLWPQGGWKVTERNSRSDDGSNDHGERGGSVGGGRGSRPEEIDAGTATLTHKSNRKKKEETKNNRLATFLKRRTDRVNLSECCIQTSRNIRRPSYTKVDHPRISRRNTGPGQELLG